jgi:transposase
MGGLYMKKDSEAKQNSSLNKLGKRVAGIDIGSRSHFIAVSKDIAEENVKEYGVYTSDLKEAIKWLKGHKIESVAMESTGVYWIPFYEQLEEAGIEVLLVDARHVKNVPGRKSDVLDCQWIQQLHEYGLLRGAFRVANDMCELRSIMRQRARLIEDQARFKLRMQKALTQMNIHLHNIISEITGPLGMSIIKDIIKGEHNPKVLAEHHSKAYKCSKEEVEKSLEGNYRSEHIFCLSQNLASYEFYQSQIKECDEKLEEILSRLTNEGGVGNEDGESSKKPEVKRRKNELYFDANGYIQKLTKVDLTKIAGINENSALKIISEIGCDMSKWRTVKHFTSWLGLSPGTKISGGKKLSTKTKRCKNKAANVLRVAAQSLARSKSALGAFFRRKRAQLGAPEAITATAHKLAKIIYIMIRNNVEYKDIGEDYYEKKYKDRLIKKISKNVESLGYKLIPINEEEQFCH